LGRPQGGPGQGRQPGQPQGGPQQGQNQGQPGGDRRGGGLNTGAAVGLGVAAGLAGGFLAATGAHGIDDIRRDRRESNEGGVDYIREPGRTIVRDGDRSYVVHDENERFRDLGLNMRSERRGDDNVAIFDRPGGEQILTYTDGEGRLVRRVRRFRDGREIVLIDNGYQGRVRDYRDDVVDLPDEPLRIPRDRFIVEADGANEELLYDTLSAPPLAPLPQRYTLDQVRYSPNLRARMRSVDVSALNFDSGSWIVPPDQSNKLQILGEAIKKAVSKNPNEVFLVEGYTDATGNPTDNLSLSDRRAQSVATILTRDFGVPPENLTTQGYGQQYLKEQTQGSSRVNRRVTLRRITPLLAAGSAPR
jgi:outer membrane protein OmpA-like peptidoglycan-associated protein